MPLEETQSAETAKLSIKERFELDKEHTLAKAKEYLKENQELIPPIHEQYYRDEIRQCIESGKFSLALENLEGLRDARSGIVTSQIPGDPTPILIRDARKCENPPIRGTESFEMQYLNAIRAGINIAGIEEKPKLEEVLRVKALEFMDRFHEDNKDKSQAELAKLLKKEIDGIALSMNEAGIEDAHKKLNVAKDFQNFNDTHHNIVTISTVSGKSGKKHTVVEAEVAMKGLTVTQEKEYQAIVNGKDQPEWYNQLPKTEQQLCEKHAKKILASKHVMSTQLRQLASMKNAFEKITAIVEPSGELTTLHQSKHAGTLASFAKDKDSRQGVTEENVRQAQEWIGKDATLHCNTLNSAASVGNAPLRLLSTLGVKHYEDAEIVSSTQKAAKSQGAKVTNTAFNALRRFGSSNDFSGAKELLGYIASNLSDNPDFATIKAHLQPKGFVGRMFRRGSAEAAIERLRNQNNIDDKTASILKEAVELRRDIEKADRAIKTDPENSSLQISTKLNKLTEDIASLESIPKGSIPKGFKAKPRTEVMLTMCASGKDRTGLAEHDQTVHAIATRTGISIEELDAQLLASGHTAQQAGSVFAGGATIGCHGTKKENKAGLPESRKEGLSGIVEKTADANKIKGKDQEVITQAVGQQQAISPQPKVEEPKKVKSGIMAKAQQAARKIQTALGAKTSISTSSSPSETPHSLSLSGKSLSLSGKRNEPFTK